jgi:hypothetical protein
VAAQLIAAGLWAPRHRVRADRSRRSCCASPAGPAGGCNGSSRTCASGPTGPA